MRLRNLIASISSTVVTWSTQWTHVFGSLTVVGGFSPGAAQAASIAAAGQTVTPAAGTSVVVIDVTTNDAFTVAAPAGTPGVGQRVLIEVQNNSGGAMGAVTFAAGIKQPAAWAEPANTKRATVSLVYDGAAWMFECISPADMA